MRKAEMNMQKMYRLGVILAVGLLLNAFIGLANLFAHPTPVHAQSPQPVIIVGWNFPNVREGFPVWLNGQERPIETYTTPSPGHLLNLRTHSEANRVLETHAAKRKQVLNKFKP